MPMGGLDSAITPSEQPQTNGQGHTATAIARD